MLLQTSRDSRGRPGLSLTEVLIAVFCMAIGMISLLALFPIGMLNMSASIRNNRLANAADNAQAIFDGYIRNDPRLEPVLGGNVAVPNPAWVWSPQQASPLWDAVNATWAFPTDGPGPPVLLDSIGEQLSLGTQWPTGFQPGGGPNPLPIQTVSIPPATSFGIRRTGAAIAQSQPLSRRWFTQEDDLTFGQTGAPDAFGTSIERERRYSVAYLCRRTNFASPSSLEVTIVLFSGRRLTGTGTGTPIPEQSVLGDPVNNGRAFMQGSRIGRVSASPVGTPPGSNELALKPGYWVLDTTVIPGTFIAPGNPNNYRNAILGGHFYQVVGVSDPDPTGFITVELDRPAQADCYVATFLYGVAAVVKRGR